ncbi:PpiC-type peptidyl-prolyl cis-trans isomerase [Nonlabens dokdonensis DSW-6]|uniref:PpiC-type peptidyl-prolyl cis-trans isomerase n=1 Tax=Nonlabens dokdonensis (strain DSM 17205 / KCTC 12402 / DSW-6) TaxID=592029 RepID=L7WBB9_NONDD|nr:PpiC-type peptidyl-prolyl cis-trans isomerase [Nonlabens dokdonensis DSW-6]
MITSLLLSSGIKAQDLNDQTILSIDGKDYDAGTFMKFYFKNIDIVQDEDQKDVDNYLQLYIDYRLKLQQAYDLGLDQKENHLKDIKNTRASLAQPYLTDNKVTESLIREGYERGREEVNASHILIKLNRGAAPADTLKAWNRIQEIYKELENGADFGELARKKSEGPSAGNEGNLGWFGSFRMAYEFETAAYETPVKTYSKPTRTDFGYHIVYVNDRRPNPGEVTVAHIMTFDKKDADEKTAKSRIDEIYKQLEEGKRFEELAREFSDDANTAPRGGKLNKFGTGGIDQTFAEAAFKLNELNEYSKPIETQYGWHIIKLLEKHPLKEFDEVKKELESKIQKSPRSRIITQAFTDKLKTQYNISKKLRLPQEVYQMVNDSLIMTSSYVFDKNGAANETKLFSIQEVNFKIKDFLSYLELKQTKDYTSYSSKNEKLDAFYQSFITDKIIEYYDENLERDNEDFRFLYNEFKEGFLVFDLIETQIWNKADNDSIGQQRYYDAHKEDYVWKRRIDIVLTQSTSDDVAQEVQKMLRQGVATDTIKARINIDNKTRVIISSGTVEDDYNRLPDDFEVEVGVSEVYHDQGDSFHKVIEVKEIIEPSLKTLEEARGRVINDYKQELEKQWIDGLRDGHKIKIHKKILKKVKSQIEKELG